MKTRSGNLTKKTISSKNPEDNTEDSSISRHKKKSKAPARSSDLEAKKYDHHLAEGLADLSSAKKTTKKTKQSDHSTKKTQTKDSKPTSDQTAPKKPKKKRPQYKGDKKKKRKNPYQTNPIGFSHSPEGSKTQRGILPGPSLRANGLTQERILEELQRILDESGKPNNFRPISPRTNRSPGGTTYSVENDFGLYKICVARQIKVNKIDPNSVDSKGKNPAAVVTPPKNGKKRVAALIHNDNQLIFKKSRNQQKVLVREGFHCSEASADKIAKALGFDGVHQLGHILSYMFVGEDGQIKFNLLSITIPSNHSMKLSDKLVCNLLLIFDEGIAIEGTAEAFEDSHFGREITHVIDNPNLLAPLEFKFDGLDRVPPSRQNFKVIKAITNLIEKDFNERQDSGVISFTIGEPSTPTKKRKEEVNCEGKIAHKVGICEQQTTDNFVCLPSSEDIQLLEEELILNMIMNEELTECPSTAKPTVEREGSLTPSKKRKDSPTEERQERLLFRFFKPYEESKLSEDGSEELKCRRKLNFEAPDTDSQPKAKSGPSEP